MATGREIDVRKAYAARDKYMIINAFLQVKDIEPKIPEMLILQFTDALKLDDARFKEFTHACWSTLQTWANENNIYIRWQ